MTNNVNPISPTNSHGRMLFGAPVLLQDWDREAEHAFQYWELFLDLLLVASASAVTDQFKEHLGFAEFVVFYVSLLNGWLLYTHHITARFQDSSFLHSMNLFLYFVGFGLCNVNTGYATVQQFCWGALLLRAAILVMLAQFAYGLPRARHVCATLATVTGVTMAAYLVVALNGRGIQDNPFIMTIFWIAASLEFFGEAFMVYALKGNLLVPINIEHAKERLGAMELICLGETILSVTLIYREMMAEKEEELEEATERELSLSYSFYWVLGWSFLLIFMFLLLYFNMQPDPEDHALRRSRAHGTLLMILHKVMGLAFLAVGVSVKLVVESLLAEEEMPELASKLMGYAVSAALILLFFMRYLHYGKREGINFGTHCMYYGIDRYLDGITTLWWWTFGLAGFVPIVGVLSGWTLEQDPVVLTASHAFFVFALVAIETFYTHLILGFLVRQEVSRGETEALVSSGGGNTYS